MKMIYLLSFDTEKIEVKEESKKENDFRNFVNFVQVREAFSENEECDLAITNFCLCDE